MYISVCRACNHFMVARRSIGTVSPCHECGGALRHATMAELNTFGQGMTAHTRRILAVEEGAECPVLPKTEHEEWLASALQRLPAAIARLPRDERQVVIAYYFDQQTLAELAETYGLDQRGTSSLIRSALAHLRAILRK